MNYEVISNDLLAHDIDEGTFDNLLFLVVLASLVVVLMLGIAFRSFSRVVYPLVGLTSALIWTYGILNLSGARFTALEATVAPLVLGLGIDYAIHLQRSQRSFAEEYPTASESWLRAVGHLSIPLSLAVVTTVAAFLANIILWFELQKWRRTASTVFSMSSRHTEQQRAPGTKPSLLSVIPICSKIEASCAKVAHT